MIKEIINKVKKSEYLLVAVSGGPDSMALLDMLYKMNLKLIVCNVNYKTRAESDLEEEIVRSYCSTRNILFFSKVIDYYSKGNFEEFARVERYKFFKEIYDQYDCKYLAVAHHLNDSLETYLLQKRRKSIVKHYGLDYHTTLMNMNIIRPLINISKNDLLEYCHINNIEYSIDVSNYDNKYERNKIRNTVLNNLSKEKMNDLIEDMKKDNIENDLFFSNIQNISKEIINDEYIDLIKFKLLNEKEKISLLYLYLEKYLKDYLKKISKKRLIDLINQIESNEGSKTFKINKEYELIKEYMKVSIKLRKKVENYMYIVNKDDEIETSIFKVSKSGNYKCEIGAYESDFPLTIRNYLPGDKIRLKEGTKKINRIFIDKKVPRPLRSSYPLVLNKDGIVIFVPKFYKDLERKSLQSGLFMVQLIYWLIFMSVK